VYIYIYIYIYIYMCIFLFTYIKTNVVECVGNDFHLSDMLNTWWTDIKYCLTFLSRKCLYKFNDSCRARTPQVWLPRVRYIASTW